MSPEKKFGVNAVSGSSPRWIRPAQVSGLRRKVKRVPCHSILKQVDPNIVSNKTSANVIMKESVFNPFRKSLPKTVEDNGIQESTDSGLFFSVSPNSKEPNFDETAVSLFDESANLDSSDLKESNETVCIHSSLPVDWSLKTKIRFASPKPFPWRGFLKTLEEASGTTGFSRCIHSSTQNQECSIDTSSNAKFHQQCLTWIHPYLPWMDVFPRMNRNEVDKKFEGSLFLNSSELQAVLHHEWCESFRSLYQLLKARQCPYFYLCSPTFTVLFRAAGISGSTETHAMITPTSRGLRQALENENINFSLPLAPECDSSNNTEEELEETDTPNKEEESESFLESLGISQDEFPSLNPKRRKIDEIKKKLSSAQTLVLVEGDDIHTLFNYLLNSRLCIQSTGPMAGVPPTLISPCAFNGGTMKSLKVKQGWVKHQKKDMHCIEISGPIMPNNVQELCSLFKMTQDGNFTSMLLTYKSTVGFTLVHSPANSFVPSAFATENLKDSGINREFLEKACKPVSKQNLVYSEINVEDKLFHCKSTNI